MDGIYQEHGRAPQRTIAFLSEDQAKLYGGYAAAAKTLRVDFIRPPIFLDDHWKEFEAGQFPEVGHA